MFGLNAKVYRGCAGPAPVLLEHLANTAGSHCNSKSSPGSEPRTALADPAVAASKATRTVSAGRIRTQNGAFGRRAR